MRYLITIVLVLFVTTCFAQLTPDEEQFVTQLYNNRQKLVELYQRSQQLSAIADTLNSETLPLELEILRQERLNIIAQRDAELQAKDIEKNTEKQTIIDTYEVQIDAKESEIATKEAELEALTP